MRSNNLAPERRDLQREKESPAALLGTGVSSESGQQLSSFTELKQGVKSKFLFSVSDSPLKPADK